MPFDQVDRFQLRRVIAVIRRAQQLLNRVQLYDPETGELYAEAEILAVASGALDGAVEKIKESLGDDDAKPLKQNDD